MQAETEEDLNNKVDIEMTENKLADIDEGPFATNDNFDGKKA